MRKTCLLLILVILLILRATAIAEVNIDSTQKTLPPSTTILKSNDCGENVTWKINTAGVLSISGSGEMDDYRTFKDTPWYEYSNQITKVIVEYGVTKIGAYAFNGCESLYDVILDESLEQIGEMAFSGCKSLQQINMPVEMIFIDRSAFKDCVALDIIHIPEGITELKDNTFYGCNNLKKIYLPKSLKSIGRSVFYDCTNVNTIYYAGTEDEFYNEMNIDSNNDAILEVYIECNYERDIPSYMITYYVDGKLVSDLKQTKKYGETVNLTTMTPSKKNYKFLGWSTQEDSTEAEYKSGEEYNKNIDTVLYAVWAKNLLTVTSSLPSGAYFNSGVSIRKFYLDCENENADIYFTTDGSEPTAESTLYDGNWIVLSDSITLKAAAYLDGEWFSEVAEYNYIYDTNLYIVEKPEFKPVNIETDDNLETALPKIVKLKTSNNDTIEVSINWDISNCNTNNIGTFEVNGLLKSPDDKYIWLDNEYKNVNITVIVSERAVKYGDVNSDGEINMKDTTRLLKYLSNWDVDITEKSSDLNADGKIDMKDATRLLRYLSGWEVELGVK